MRTVENQVMSSEEAARSLNIDHSTYLHVLTETTRREYEAGGGVNFFLSQLATDERNELLQALRLRTHERNKCYYEKTSRATSRQNEMRSLWRVVLKLKQMDTLEV